MTNFTVTLTDDARADLSAIKDNRTYQAVVHKLRELATEPDKRGKALTGGLKGLYSVRAAGQRYHVAYRLAQLEDLVIVVVISLRRAGKKTGRVRVARRRLRKG